MRKYFFILATVGLLLCFGNDNRSWAQTNTDGYVVSVGDSISVSVYGEPELSIASFSIVDDAGLVLPLIGEIATVGRTIKAIEREITEKLADGYLIRPQVTVAVVEFRPFFVVGEVKQPGKIAFLDDMNVRRALILAGGLTDSGDSNRITIEKVGQSREPLPAQLTTRVDPGDIIHVGELAKFSLRGAVRFPDTLNLSPGLTLDDAIAMAGGLSANADKSNIKLERDGKVTDVAGELSSVVVQADDVITVGIVEEIPKQEQEKFSIYLQGEIRSPGRYEYIPGLTVEKAIVIAGGFTDRASRRKINITRDGDPPIEMRRVDPNTLILPGDVIEVGVSLF